MNVMYNVVYTDAVPFHLAFYGQGTGLILLDELGCLGTEQRLIDCPHPITVGCSRGHVYRECWSQMSKY